MPSFAFSASAAATNNAALAFEDMASIVVVLKQTRCCQWHLLVLTAQLPVAALSQEISLTMQIMMCGRRGQQMEPTMQQRGGFLCVERTPEMSECANPTCMRVSHEHDGFVFCGVQICPMSSGQRHHMAKCGPNNTFTCVEMHTREFRGKQRRHHHHWLGGKC